jgi:DNA-binding winged helix-turn-helix (wHTH) protein/tetratricopeptide (TPR) repeat protein
MNSSENSQWLFGSFRLDASQHLLFRDGELVPVSKKAADILLVLVEQHGQLVEKETLMKRVWPDAFVEESNLAVHISQLRKIINDEDSAHRIETIPRRGYRFVGAVARESTPQSSMVPTRDSSSNTSPASVINAAVIAGPVQEAAQVPPAISANRTWVWAAVGVLAFAVIVALALHYDLKRSHGTESPTAVNPPAMKDSVVMADIANNTGDPVFDTTLREALEIELEQSPYLMLVPEQRIQNSLRLMGKAADARLTPEVAREVCQRTAGEAVLDGSIAKLGNQYVLGLRAVNCRTGDHLSDLQTTAAGKEQVLKALGDISGQLRRKLGESLATLQKFDTPIEEATTPSLEALQAYSLGRQAMVQKGESASCVPFFQRAIRLDPEFAVAYAALGNAYSNLGETGMAATNIRKAYELREHVGEHERLYIESHYFQFVTGDLGKAAQTYEVWAATYPNDEAPRTNLAVIYSDLGNLEQSAEQAKEAVRIAPDDGQTYANLVDAYLLLNQLDQARAVADQAIARNLDTPNLRLYLYNLAFLKHDAAGREKILTWAAGEPGIEDTFLSDQANEAAFAGHLVQARSFTERATDSAKRADEKETAAGYEIDAAQREALFGNAAEAKRLADAALALANDRDTRYGAAVAFAIAGATDRAHLIADQLSKEFPDDTFVQGVYLPTIRGAIAVGQKDPASAIKALDPAAPYDLGLAGELLPAYVRGLAYLEQRDGAHAVVEFQKLIDHAGILLSAPIGPLAHLQIARAWLLQGNRDRAKTEYEQFFTAWKDADSDIPILKEARSEYASQFAQKTR